MISQVDRAHPFNLSGVLRYRSLLFPDTMGRCLESTTLREGFRLLELEPYRDVRLFLMDESTCMHSGTYKSLDGCVTIAMAKQLGYSRIVCSSGANTGRALTEYGQHAGIETFFFCPDSTLFKLPREIFQNPGAHLISVEGSDRRVKDAAERFSEITRTPLVPELQWRILASGVRGMFLAEQMCMRNERFDWFGQAVCAGFGPIGVYKALQNLVEGGLLERSWIPSFLGVQQAALAPIAAAWARGDADLQQRARWSDDPVIEPSLYNAQPAQTYPMLREILSASGGDAISVKHQEFVVLGKEYLRRVEGAGVRLSRGSKGEPLENAGLLAGAGVLKAIDSGRIRSGQRVVCSLTGGASEAPSGTAQPEYQISLDADLEAKLQEYCNEDLFQSIR